MSTLEELARQHGVSHIVEDVHSAPFVTRHEANPVLSAEHVPYPSSLVFNCSVIKEDGKYLMLFRNDIFPAPGVPGAHDRNFGVAESTDGISWTVWPEPVFPPENAPYGKPYDPRLVRLEGRYYMTCCCSFGFGPQAGTFVTDDLRHYEMIDVSMPCSRNTLLFPEKINGKYYRLERPFWQAIDSYSNENSLWIGQAYSTWISSSPDLIHWGQSKCLINAKDVPYANVKIGPGATPIRTDRGWLLLIHGVDFDPRRGKNGWEAKWQKRYHAGVALADLEDPTKLIGLSPDPLITPEAPYEVEGGYRNNVIFPMAGIVEDGGTVKIYYGAADAHVCLATAPLAALLDACKPVG
ncbi:MAG: glycoside hydrolase family 130 protein [Kiritimatiellae bacterium]|nr:glycoside hydrolase family 130 protein [Kiritimatiellia bacterium]